jgi:hypothetical protein
MQTIQRERSFDTSHCRLHYDSSFWNKVRLQKDVSGLPPSDLHGSQGWREKVLGDREFMQECRNLVFSFCADGVNPFGKSVQYSMWPLMLRNENVSAETRYKYDNFLLWGLIPGEYIVSSSNGVKHRERRQAKSLTPYLDLLVEELLQLDAGIACHDGSLPIGHREFQVLLLTLI